jgi:hypothetical protein
VRGGSRNWWAHVIAPVIGFAILAFVVVNAKVAAQVLGFVWFAIGLVLLIGLVMMGRRPELTLDDSAPQASAPSGEQGAR